MVRVGHLLLDLEVAAVTQSLENEVGVELVCRVNGQAMKALDAYTGQVGEARRQHVDSLVDGEDATGLGRVVQCHHDHSSEEFDSLLDDIDMTKVQWIEAARIQNSGR